MVAGFPFKFCSRYAWKKPRKQELCNCAHGSDGSEGEKMDDQVTLETWSGKMYDQKEGNKK